MNDPQGFEALFSHIALPRFARIVCKPTPPLLHDPIAHACQTIRGCPALQAILPGQRVAIAVGSREIALLPELVRAMADAIKSRGANPFIVPAMGSHGGGTAEGQRAMLHALEVTEQGTGAPIVSDMAVRLLGHTTSGVPVFMDAQAYAADHTVLIARVKPHTDFHGRYESGVLKMLAVGLGKGEGAAAFHEACDQPSQRILDMASVVMERGNTLLALAVVEDASHRPAAIDVLPIRDYPHREPALLEQARALLPRVPFGNLETLVVDEMGKNISGTGMDPNVTGRPHIPGGTAEIARYIAVLSLTDASHGNATGMGYADVITRDVLDAVDWQATLRNCLTSRDTQAQKVPTVVSSGAQALRCCLYCTGSDSPRVARIRNTMQLDQLFVSNALRSEVDAGQYDIVETDLGFEDCMFWRQSLSGAVAGLKIYPRAERAIGQRGDVVGGDFKDVVVRALGVQPAGHMRRDQRVSLLPQRVLRGQRLRRGHVQPRAGDRAVLQRLAQRILVNRAAAPYVQYIGARAHAGKGCRVQHRAGVIGFGQRQHDHLGPT